MEWHIFKCVQNNKDNSGKFLINFHLKKSVLELSIIQNTVAWSDEVSNVSVLLTILELRDLVPTYVNVLRFNKI